MATAHATKSVVRGDKSVPPFEPDPEVMGNDEGNERILKHDRDAAREFLRRQAGTSERRG